MDPTFLPFYTGTAVRKFFFFLDPYHTGRIKILDILSCGFIDDFLDVIIFEIDMNSFFSIIMTMNC